MPKINNIIASINTSVAAALSTEAFQSGIFYNQIVELISITDKDETKPVMIDDDGEGTPVIIDDTLPFQIYHRLKSLSHESVPAGYDSFGDGGDFIKETANMVMIVISDRSRIRMRGEDFLSVIAANIPVEFLNTFLTPLNLINASTEIESTNTDKEEVWKGEYNTAYMLKPNGIMYALNYKIITIFSKQCFPVCEVD